jgi:hypothetical protein
MLSKISHQSIGTSGFFAGTDTYTNEFVETVLQSSSRPTIRVVLSDLYSFERQRRLMVAHLWSITFRSRGALFFHVAISQVPIWHRFHSLWQSSNSEQLIADLLYSYRIGQRGWLPTLRLHMGDMHLLDKRRRSPGMCVSSMCLWHIDLLI